MATSKSTDGPVNLPILNVRAPMPFVCPCSYQVLILACLYGVLLSWRYVGYSRVSNFVVKKKLGRVPSLISLFEDALFAPFSPLEYNSCINVWSCPISMNHFMPGHLIISGCFCGGFIFTVEQSLLICYFTPINCYKLVS